MMGLGLRRKNAAASGLWTPASLPDLSVWIEGDTLAQGDGNPIGTWTDASGTGHSPTAVTTDRPTCKTSILNGLTIARFDGTNKLTYPSVPLSGAGGTLISVHKLDADPPSVGNAGSPIGSWCSDNTANDHWPFTDGVIYCGFGTNSRKTVGNPASTMVAFRIYAIVAAAGDWRFYLGGGAAFFSTVTNTVAWPSVAPSLGASPYGGGAYKFKGDLYGQIACNSALSLTDLNLAGNYLAAKTALAWSTAT
jgi:hypothetical protein